MQRFAAVMLVLTAIASPALAMTDQEFIATYRKNIQQLESQINGCMKERTVRCPKQQSSAEKAACDSAFNTLIARHRDEQSMNELRIAAFGLNEDRKNGIFRTLGTEVIDRHNKVTLDLEFAVKLMFPAPNDSTAKEPPTPVVTPPTPPSIALPPSTLVQPTPVTLEKHASAEVKLPPTGVLHAKKGSSGVAPFNVIGAKENHYVVRLVNEDGRKREITIFVRAGSRYDGKVPFGKYRILTAHGTNWISEKDLFGDETEFARIRTKDDGEVVNFYQDKTTTSTHGKTIIRTIAHGKSLTLEKIAGGNVERSHITRAEFEDN
jgi:hypothetical protein